MYVKKWYMSGGIWKINVMTIIKSEMNKVSSFAYILESSNLWHGRLGHVNYDTLCKLINLNHIQTFQIDAKHKCETCVVTPQNIPYSFSTSLGYFVGII